MKQNRTSLLTVPMSVVIRYIWVTCVKSMYNRDMKFTDQFSIVLTSEEYDMLNEVMPFAASFDFTEHHEGKTFDILWDKILKADHQITSSDS